MRKNWKTGDRTAIGPRVAVTYRSGKRNFIRNAGGEPSYIRDQRFQTKDFSLDMSLGTLFQRTNFLAAHRTVLTRGYQTGPGKPSVVTDHLRRARKAVADRDRRKAGRYVGPFSHPSHKLAQVREAA